VETINHCSKEARKDRELETAVDVFSELFDTSYTDVEAWSELADLYISLYQYVCCILTTMQICFCFPGPVSRSLVGSTKPVLCSPGRRNSIHIPLAIRFFFITIEMVGDDEEPPLPTGITVCVRYGVELVLGSYESVS